MSKFHLPNHRFGVSLMDKKVFLDMFRDQDKNYISGLYEDVELCRNIEVPIYTKDFLTPDIYMKLKANENKLGVMVQGNGVFEDCERRMVKFSVHQDTSEDFELDVLIVTNKSKFKELGHRDYLGSIMALGIKRNLFGDLVVEGNKCYIPVASSVSNYIIDNLNQIGNCPCTVEILNEDEEQLPKINFNEKNIIATSLRIDNVVPGICNISRARGTELINGGAVLLNYQICDRKDKIVEINDTITIRGFGKFKVRSIIGETGKGRIKLLVGKYI